MDFSESPKVKAVRGIVRDFMEKEVYPLEPALRQQGFKALLPVLKEKRERARETGLWAAHLPEEFGGAGLSLTEFAHMSEELGKSPIGHYLFNVQAPDVGNMELLMAHGSPEQKERFLLPLARGDIRSCFTMTEPEFAGSNPVWMGTTARREGAEWVLRGHKWFASSADGAAFAICMAVTSPEAANVYRRASMILVPTDTPGFTLLGNASVMGERGGDWASHGEVSYQDARVPAANLLGVEGAGFVLAQERLGPGNPLGSKQIVQQGIPESRAEIHAARLMVLHAAWRIEKEGAEAAREEISLIKVTVARTMQKVLDRAIQGLGALGMTDDTPLAWWYAHERAARIYDGADEVHLEAVARRILRGYGMSTR